MFVVLLNHQFYFCLSFLTWLTLLPLLCYCFLILRICCQFQRFSCYEIYTNVLFALHCLHLYIFMLPSIFGLWSLPNIFSAFFQVRVMVLSGLYCPNLLFLILDLYRNRILYGEFSEDRIERVSPLNWDDFSFFRN